VPTTPVRFKVPPVCKLCGAAGTVTPETTIERGVVRLMWCCRACSGEWPITDSEKHLLERRRAIADRQRRTGSDRQSE
jgi:hypothetical protein